MFHIKHCMLHGIVKTIQILEERRRVTNIPTAGPVPRDRALPCLPMMVAMPTTVTVARFHADIANGIWVESVVYSYQIRESYPQGTLSQKPLFTSFFQQLPHHQHPRQHQSPRTLFQRAGTLLWTQHLLGDQFYRWDENR